MFQISRYTAEDATVWNQFVAQSKQGTFLFDRRYMDYHADRFTDCSWIVRRGNSVRALLPANIVGSTLLSHQGLTYGGLLTDHKAKTTDVSQMFLELNSTLKDNGIRHVSYKAMPWIYHRLPAEEDLYALTQVCHAHLAVREVSTSIDLSHRLKFEESRRSGIRKAVKVGISYRESDDMRAFWRILNTNLETRYGVRPVHTLAEISLLKSRFPGHIRLFMAYEGESPVAGTLVYETPQVIHTQYISASPRGKETGALDLLFDQLINHHYSHMRYFDFGKSTEDQGHHLNHQLIFQKEGFGGRAVCYDSYEYDL